MRLVVCLQVLIPHRICLRPSRELYSTTKNYLVLNMSNLASSSLRQVSWLCTKHISSAGLIRVAPLSRAIPALAQKTARRGYVSETKKDNAQVNVETAIRADQKAFFAETGKLPENQLMQGAGANADTMMSPIAGLSEWLICSVMVLNAS